MEENLMELFEGLLKEYDLEKLEITRRDWSRTLPAGKEKDMLLKLIDDIIKTK